MWKTLAYENEIGEGTSMLWTGSLIGIEGVASIQVGADGVIVPTALTDDSRFTVIAFLQTEDTGQKGTKIKRIQYDTTNICVN